MSRVPVRLPKSDNSSRVPAERRKVRRQPRKRASAMLTVAQDYAAVGLPVFPLRPGDKCPLTPHGRGDATADAGQILRWSMRWPTASHQRKRTEVGDRISVTYTGASVLISGGAS